MHDLYYPSHDEQHPENPSWIFMEVSHKPPYDGADRRLRLSVVFTSGSKRTTYLHRQMTKRKKQQHTGIQYLLDDTGLQ